MGPSAAARGFRIHVAELRLHGSGRVTDPARGLLRPAARRAEALKRNHRFHFRSHRQAVLSERAREMRLIPTSSEHLLWVAIRGGRLGVQFRRQVVLGRYIADFFAAEVELVVEVDGGYHGRVRERSDERRDRWLQRHGYTVLRLSDALALNNIGAAVALIAEQVAALRR
ncbi:MAG TPA: DUF559 domain-containing protein [Polyangiaceae bacterium]